MADQDDNEVEKGDKSGASARTFGGRRAYPCVMGRVQRQIFRALTASLGRPLTTVDLCRWAYPRIAGGFNPSHHKAVIRAADQVGKRVGRTYPGGIKFQIRED